MGLSPTILKPMNVPLYGFSGYTIWPSGEVELLVTVGSHPVQATMLPNFLVVDTPRVYKAIIRRPTLNDLRAIASTYHLALKFSTPSRIGVVHGNQIEARRCYTLALKGQPNVRQETNVIVGMGQLPQPVKENSGSYMPRSSAKMSPASLRSLDLQRST